MGGGRRSGLLFLSRWCMPYATPYIHKEIVAQAVSAAAVFFVTLIIVSLFTVRLSDAILDSKIGALDRSLGFLFGAARGFLLAVDRVLDLQLAGRRETAARVGEDRQDAAGADRNRRQDHRHVAGGRRQHDRRLDQGEERRRRSGRGAGRRRTARRRPTPRRRFALAERRRQTEARHADQQGGAVARAGGAGGGTPTPRKT